MIPSLEFTDPYARVCGRGPGLFNDMKKTKNTIPRSQSFTSELSHKSMAAPTKSQESQRDASEDENPPFVKRSSRGRARRRAQRWSVGTREWGASSLLLLIKKPPIINLMLPNYYFSDSTLHIRSTYVAYSNSKHHLSLLGIYAEP